MAGWLIDFQEFSREKRVCTVSVNQWVTNEEKQYAEKCGPFSEPSVVCIGDTEDSKTQCCLLLCFKPLSLFLTNQIRCPDWLREMRDGEQAEDDELKEASKVR